jgi:ligand-binding sensor domain-containing protein
MKLIIAWLLLGITFNLFSDCKTPAPSISSDLNQTDQLQPSAQTLPQEIWTMFQSEDNSYWFGSNGMGVFHQTMQGLTQYTIEDDLISNTIRGIQEDEQGMIYIETPEGVSQYDGRTFHNLTPVISTTNQWELHPEDLWFNCNGDAGDIFRYDGNTMYQLQLPRQDLMSAFGIDTTHERFSPYSVFGVDKDLQGNLWIGTATAGAFRFDGDEFLWVREPELSVLPDQRVPGVRSMLQDTDSSMLLSNFVHRYEVIQMGTMSTYKVKKGFTEDVPYFIDRLPYFNSGIRDHRNQLWMTTYSGTVYQYDGDNLLEHHVQINGKSAAIISIYEDRYHNIFLCTQNLGVLRWTGLRFDPYEL